MAKIAFTDPTVRNLPLPEKGQRAYWDESLPGFGLRVSQGGAKTWIVLDPRSKVRTQETIGRYPLVSLQEARGEAKRRLAEQTLGRHRPRSVAWNTALEAYLKEKAAKRKARTHRDYKRLLNRHFKFGSTKLSDLGPHDLQKKLDKLVDTPSEEHHAFVALRVFMNWCHRKYYFSEHPMARMKSEHEPRSRSRVLSDEELKKIWKACPDDTFGRIVKLLMLTGQRRGEISGLLPEMLEEDLLKLPPELTKNNREHVFPVGAFALSLLIFPLKFGGWGKSKARLDKVSGVKGWTLHDLRRTFRTNLGKLGVKPHIAERLVNHITSRTDMEEVYDRHSYLVEMREAIEKWEAHVRALTSVPVQVTSVRLSSVVGPSATAT